jgi:hypothetical protein
VPWNSLFSQAISPNVVAPTTSEKPPAAVEKAPLEVTSLHVGSVHPSVAALESVRAFIGRAVFKDIRRACSKLARPRCLAQAGSLRVAASWLPLASAGECPLSCAAGRQGCEVSPARSVRDLPRASAHPAQLPQSRRTLQWSRHAAVPNPALRASDPLERRRHAGCLSLPSGCSIGRGSRRAASLGPQAGRVRLTERTLAGPGASIAPDIHRFAPFRHEYWSRRTID